MSYDLKIWSRRSVEIDVRTISFDDYTLTIDESVKVEEEDIPTEVILLLAGIKFLTELHLQPFTQDKSITDKAMRFARKLGKEFDGVIENPQLNEEIVIVNKAKAFKPFTRDAEMVKISWYMDSQQSLAVNIAQFIDLLEKYLPQALPRRYGAFEPPQYKYAETGKDHLIDFLLKEHLPVLYCTKPINFLFLSDGFIAKKWPRKENYRCNSISILILKEAYLEDNWQFAVKRLFMEVARLYKPFYAEIIEEKESKVVTWWWKGIPVKRGNPMIIGEPYSTLSPKLSVENKLESGLYYFENSKSIKIPQKLISKKKLSALGKPDKLNFAENYHYAKLFPFQNTK